MIQQRWNILGDSWSVWRIIEANCMRLSKAMCWVLLPHAMIHTWGSVWKAAQRKRTWGCWSTAGWTWTSMCPDGQGGQWHQHWISNSVASQDQGSDCPPVFSTDEATPWVLCSLRKILVCWNLSREGQQSRWKVWSTRLMMSSWGSWRCLPWRKAGSSETLLLPTATWKECNSHVSVSLFSQVTSYRTR